MRLLVVARGDSIHTARWLSQLRGRGWDIHLFPSINIGIDAHPEMRELAFYHGGCGFHAPTAGGVRFRGVSPIARLADLWRGRVAKRPESARRAERLAVLVARLKPDIVHSLEIQNAGELVLAAKRIGRSPFPPWISTNWGSDIFLFGRLPECERTIREILSVCDFYSCECHRDVELARSFGFRGEVLPVFPNAGGFDLSLAAALRAPGPVSSRRSIVLKGYQHWAGRALTAMRALERCADALGGYEVVIHSAMPDVVLSARLFARSAGVPVRILPPGTPHREILAEHGRARISIGLSISDAISTSLLEAIVMGAFPVQSRTACADEWVTDGESALLVPPEDPEAVEAALRRALADDALVDGAAARNLATASARLERSLLAAAAVDLYGRVAGGDR